MSESNSIEPASVPDIPTGGPQTCNQISRYHISRSQKSLHTGHRNVDGTYGIKLSVLYTLNYLRLKADGTYTLSSKEGGPSAMDRG